MEQSFFCERFPPTVHPDNSGSFSAFSRGDGYSSSNVPAGHSFVPAGSSRVLPISLDQFEFDPRHCFRCFRGAGEIRLCVECAGGL